MTSLPVMFIAGDPSGDEHASHVLHRLKAILPCGRFFGIGGPAMASHSFEQLMPFEEFNRMGLLEVIEHLPFFLKAKQRLIETMDKEKPKVLVCIDYPGMNIPLMKAAHERGIPVVWYIVPQVWAWKKNRAAILGRYASFIGTVFPFEVDYFKNYSAPVSFVGHPLVEAMEKRALTEPSICRASINDGNPIRIALIPGSRKQEIENMLAVMLQVIPDFKDYQFVVGGMSSISPAFYERVLVAAVFRRFPPSVQ